MKFRVLATAGLLAIGATVAQAQTNVSPDLSAGLGGFYTDRYAPAGFNLMNGIQGRDNVLQIDINSTTDALNRPGGQQGSFYNTQGMKTDVNTGGSWLFQSDLFVDAAWANNQDGFVRTDLWATATDDIAYLNPSAYPIVGFTNYGGAARFRGYDVNTGLWIDFASTVNLGAWNTLGMAFDVGTNSFQYFVNGVMEASIIGDYPTTGVGNVMYQAYNFNDPLIPVAGNPAYTANWSNTLSEVPEPSTLALLAVGLFLLGVATRRRQNNVVASARHVA